MNRGLFTIASALYLLFVTLAVAQEPAYIYGNQAVRYVEGADFFH